MNSVTHNLSIANFAVGPDLAHDSPLQSLYSTIYINMPFIYFLSFNMHMKCQQNPFAKLSSNALELEQISQTFFPSYFTPKILKKIIIIY